ncbi:unnamed protein product [Oppiella nova]|uniref:Uncharacterized protein n=1 Tax=Oppiella nova TaxID=334625 RepID=A0A7R9MJI9_9ACAR|nr:unnamed protein product [Oppiella nova]CAG2178512.1 unnamed protein product [Oppiella nova]
MGFLKSPIDLSKWDRYVYTAILFGSGISYYVLLTVSSAVIPLSRTYGCWTLICVNLLLYSPLRLSAKSATNIYSTSIAIYSAGLVLNIFYPYNIIDSGPVFNGMPMGGQYLHVSGLLSHVCRDRGVH